jgi:hypothetical protein
MNKKSLVLPAIAALFCVMSVGAQAAEGCGPGWHRGGNGRCYPNGGGGVVMVAPVAPVVVVAPVGVVCGPGLRWHPGRHRCWAY